MRYERKDAAAVSIHWTNSSPNATPRQRGEIRLTRSARGAPYHQRREFRADGRVRRPDRFRDEVRVVRCDQPRALDLKARGGKKVKSVPAAIMEDVLARLTAIFE